MPASVLLRPATEAIVDRLLSAMSLEEKIGQMIQADIASITPEELHRYKLGSILAGGLSAPAGNLRSSAAVWRDLIGRYKHPQPTTLSNSHSEIPILFGIDAVHGNAKIPGATIFPHNVGLGAAHDPDLVARIGAATAEEVAAIGADWAFAPTIAVVRDVRWGRAYESYSDDPLLVGAYATAMVTGLQGNPGSASFLRSPHVLASAKHFLGDGGTDAGRDQGDTLVSEEILRDVHGKGYRAAIAAGAGTIMASYNAWHGEKMHANASLLTGVLKQRWQFGGFVIGDWNAQEEIPGCTKFSCAAEVNAGVDMIMAPDSWKQIYDHLLDQAHSGLIPIARIDDAVRRILRVKALAGLIAPDPRVEPITPVPLAALGSPAHRALAREAVRKSLVLLKNDGAVLPIGPRQHILVVGEAADSIGEQCGGWTVDWQGANNTNADFAGATSIFRGIMAAAEQSGGSAQLSPDGTYTQKPDVAIVVFGEHPYAEFEGDRENLIVPQEARLRTLLEKLHSQHIPVVSVLLSGRPLWVNPELNRSDAFVAAWLPGGEGEGIADLLFRAPSNEPARDFTGRLSFPWPATAMPVTYDAHGTISGALFPDGYGLSVAKQHMLGQVPEDTGISPMPNDLSSFYSSGHVTAPWSIYIGDPAAQLRVTLEEQQSPGGALRTVRHDGDADISWAGRGEGIWSIGDTPIDLSGRSDAGAVLRVTYRVDVAPRHKMMLGVQCGNGCAGWADVTKSLVSAPKGEWQTMRIPLACFTLHGADLRHVEQPFVLKTDGRAAISLRDISVAPGERSAACPVG